MKKYIKHLGLLCIMVGLGLFLIHILANIHGNMLLFTGLTFIIGGTIAHVKLQKHDF